MIIAIDFEEVYPLISLSPDFSEATFHTFDRKENPILIKVLLKLVDNLLLPGVHNLAFGPISEDGSIDDQVRINIKIQVNCFQRFFFFV